MNKNIELIQEEYIKYPYLIESELESMFTNIFNDKRNFKRKVGNSTRSDRYRTLKMLKEHIQYLMEND